MSFDELPRLDYAGLAFDSRDRLHLGQTIKQAVVNIIPEADILTFDLHDHLSACLILDFNDS